MTRDTGWECRDVEARIADDLAASLTDAEVAGIEAHCAACETCRREVESLRRVWEELGALGDEVPEVSLRPRFDAMLAGYLEARETVRRPWSARLADRWRGWWPATPAWQAGLAAAALLAGLAIGGRAFQPRPDSELRELRDEVAGLSRLVGLSLLERGSASDRLRGVSYSRGAAADPEVLDALLEAVREDPDVNVRLAAIDVLADFVERGTILDGLRAALERQDAPLVQLALVDLLLAANGAESRAAVRRLLADEELDDTVRRYVTSRLDAEV